MSDIREEIIEEDEDTQKGKYMTFKSGDETYGLGISYVSEIIGIQQITVIPETEEYIKGLINLRGKIIPVVDVRIRFKKEPKEYNDRTCIIVIEVKGVMIGLIVDTIAEVVTISDEDIVPPPSLGANAHTNKYVYGIGRVGNEVKLLLDPDKLLNDEELESLKESVEGEEEE